MSSPDYLFQEAQSHYSAGRLRQAERKYRQVLSLLPSHAESWQMLGVIAQQRAEYDRAVEYHRQAVKAQPEVAVHYSNLGNSLAELDRREEAQAAYETALRLKPEFSEAHYNLACLQKSLGQWQRAEEGYREAIRLNPTYRQAYNNLGCLLRNQNRPGEAEACFRSAIDLEPDYPEAQSNLASVLIYTGRIEEAEACYRRALMLDPGSAEDHSNLGFLLLLAGRYKEGWEEHEWRWKSPRAPGLRRDFAQPEWNGADLGDRTLLLYAEQGLGDTVQFCRYAPLVAAKGRVILEVQRPLLRLLDGFAGVERIVAKGDQLPAFDLHCSLMSLPRAFGTTLETIPLQIPYLRVSPALQEIWHQRIGEKTALRVGLVWAGNPRLHLDGATAIDRRRSLALAALAPLGDVPRVSLISLQKGPGAEQARTPPERMSLFDPMDEVEDFAETAAIIAGLDLVISVDTSVAHVAAALGKPVWLLNRFDTCWRWQLDREDSPWYPTVRQFRQPSPGDWESVVVRVRAELQRVAEGDRSRLLPVYCKSMG